MRIDKRYQSKKRMQLLFFSTFLRAVLEPEINLRMVVWLSGRYERVAVWIGRNRVGAGVQPNANVFRVSTLTNNKDIR